METRISKHIKSFIPKHLKYPLWYIFKAPQRIYGWHTLYHDILGIMFLIHSRLLFKQRPKPISICTGLYNRSESYLNIVLESVHAMHNSSFIELSIFDCASTDIPNLEKRIRETWKGKLVFHSEPIPFSRSRAFNKAVNQATSNIIFLCDADMQLPKNFVYQCSSLVRTKQVWFPICFFLFKDKQPHIAKENGVWAEYDAHGMVACLKSEFMQLGMLNETYTTWGGEDNDLWHRFHKAGFIVIRNKVKGLFHHWHDTFNEKFKHMNSRNSS